MSPKINTKGKTDFTGREFTITREFNAPPEAVFNAWTDPKLLALWWGPKGFTNPVCEWDVRPGGKIHDVMRAPDGAEHPMGGKFHEIVEPERIVLSCGALDEKGDLLFEFLHTVTFVEHKGKTKLTVHSRVLNTTAEANKYIGGFEAGMTSSLERITDLVAQKGPFVIERVFDAPVELVWRAITTKEDMARWYFDLEEFKQEKGFEFKFTVEHEGFTYCHNCKVTEVVHQKKIAYTWRYEGYEGDSLVSFELLPQNGKTKLKLTHQGLETFPKLPSFARHNFVRGWTMLVGTSLKDFVENVDREIVISRVVKAPRELVWEAMTNPKHVVNWWGPHGFTDTIEEMDVRPGGAWKHTMHGPDGTNYPNMSIFKEVVKPERIVYSLGGGRAGEPGVSFVSTWTFDALKDGSTRVTIRMVFPSTEKRDFVVKEFGAIEGGKQTLERLDEYLLKMPALP
jgi:uncharacterized protein YndB with AHSA1/START domain